MRSNFFQPHPIAVAFQPHRESEKWVPIAPCFTNQAIPYLSREYTDPDKSKGLEQQLDTLREELTRIKALDIPRIESAYERGLYDEDKLQERLTQKNQEIIAIEENISDVEDQLTMMTSASTEAKKLREASAQIKYKLEHLDRAQKKVLCHLFLDRIEMYRNRPNDQKRWTVHAEIFFRFNPARVPTKLTKVRTPKPLEKASEGVLERGNGLVGETGRDRYPLFRFAVWLKSNRNRVWLEEIAPHAPNVGT